MEKKSGKHKVYDGMVRSYIPANMVINYIANKIKDLKSKNKEPGLIVLSPDFDYKLRQLDREREYSKPEGNTIEFVMGTRVYVADNLEKTIKVLPENGWESL